MSPAFQKKLYKIAEDHQNMQLKYHNGCIHFIYVSLQAKTRKEKIIMFNFIYNNTVIFMLLVGVTVYMIREFNQDINQYRDTLIYFNEFAGVSAIGMAILLHVNQDMLYYYGVIVIILITLIFDSVVMYRIYKTKEAQNHVQLQ